MDEYESLVLQYSAEIDIYEIDLYNKTGLHAAYRNGVIFIEKKLNRDEKIAYLIEEYSHYKTTVGVIIDETIVSNAKQEQLARKLTFHQLISIDSLIDAYNEGLRYYYEVSDYLGVPESLLREVVDYYKSSYGIIFHYRNYLINLGNTIVIENKYKGVQQ